MLRYIDLLVKEKSVVKNLWEKSSNSGRFHEEIRKYTDYSFPEAPEKCLNFHSRSNRGVVDEHLRDRLKNNQGRNKLNRREKEVKIYSVSLSKISAKKSQKIGKMS
ncbi:MAG: hypothetical protein SWX82_00615 [Cyanobacteriota bacterium]|nr:hypothetical protein [Cyanobacteriota bacterium]